MRHTLRLATGAREQRAAREKARGSGSSERRGRACERRPREAGEGAAGLHHLRAPGCQRVTYLPTVWLASWRMRLNCFFIVAPLPRWPDAGEGRSRPEPAAALHGPERSFPGDSGGTAEPREPSGPRAAASRGHRRLLPRPPRRLLPHPPRARRAAFLGTPGAAPGARQVRQVAQAAGPVPSPARDPGVSAGGRASGPGVPAAPVRSTLCILGLVVPRPLPTFLRPKFAVQGRAAALGAWAL